MSHPLPDQLTPETAWLRQITSGQLRWAAVGKSLGKSFRLIGGGTLYHFATHPRPLVLVAPADRCMARLRGRSSQTQAAIELAVGRRGSGDIEEFTASRVSGCATGA